MIPACRSGSGRGDGFEHVASAGRADVSSRRIPAARERDSGVP
jgi:hypothetical protein